MVAGRLVYTLLAALLWPVCSPAACFPFVAAHCNASKQEDFKGVVKAANGFVYRPERPDAETFVQQKWAWSGTGPGVEGHGTMPVCSPVVCT